MDPKRSLVLVGPMGVGKTTLGKKLARNLGVQFLDTDSLVTAKHGEIPDIFANQGEPAFRRFEEEAVAEAVGSESADDASYSAVVATGGGAVLSQTTRQLLKSAATVIYLATDGKHIKARLVGGKRPLVQNGFDDWIRIYDERKPIYEEVADITVNVSGKSLAAAISEITEKLGTK